MNYNNRLPSTVYSSISNMSTAATESYYTKLESGVFQCKYCDKQSAKQNTMYYHVQTKHVQDYKFTCAHCTDKKFVQKSAYLQHMAQAHPTDAAEEANPYVGVSFACTHPGCAATAKTKANMLVHFARSHCKEWIPAFAKGTACKCCEKVFASSTAYFYHAATSFEAPGDFAGMLAKIK